MKKPTGSTGLIRITSKDASYKKIKFPDTKEEIEAFIMERFVRDTNKQNTFFKFTSFNQNQQNDFDFSVETTIGKNDLDLMEIAILDKGDYKLANKQHNDLELTKCVLNKISGKLKKYGYKKLPLFLLLYTTDFKFNLSELTIQHLKYLLNKETHCFAMIFYFSLLDEQEGYARLLFPSEINEFDEERYKDNMMLNLL